MSGKISSDVHILTSADLKKIKDQAFARGVERGRFELGCELEKLQAEESIKETK